MTQQEIETELSGLRDLVLQQQQQEEARRKNWRSISKSATILAVMLCAGALGLLVVGFALDFGSPSSNTRFFGSLAPMLILVSLPLSLLRAALSDPISPR
jgi:cytochrome bd-type quinol oxidase subunit 2